VVARVTRSPSRPCAVVAGARPIRLRQRPDGSAITSSKMFRPLAHRRHSVLKSTTKATLTATRSSTTSLAGRQHPASFYLHSAPLYLFFRHAWLRRANGWPKRRPCGTPAPLCGLVTLAPGAAVANTKTVAVQFPAKPVHPGGAPRCSWKR